LILDENEASALADLLMDYIDNTPEYDSAIRKLLAARDSQQDFTKSDLLVMLSAIKEYYDDTAVCTASSYDSCPSDSFAFSDVLSTREFFYRLRKRIQNSLTLLQSES